MYTTSIYMFKVNIANTSKMSEICSKLTLKRPEELHWHRSDVFFVNFAQISRIYFVFSLKTWNEKMPADYLVLS